jgi:RNA polymerase sigma-70 factor (ECF subfamily)
VPSYSGANRSDGELLYAHIAGDRYAFEELFRRHSARLYRLARRRSHTAEDACDAVQDAMHCAHRAPGSFRHDAPVSNWLCRIVVNACRDRMRRNAIRPTVTLTPENCPPVADRTGQLETALLVRQALLRLPAAQRDAVVAVDMHGYSVADAAALFDVAEGRLALDLEVGADRHADVGLDLGVGIDETGVQVTCQDLAEGGFAAAGHADEGDVQGGQVVARDRMETG